jgi:von Willebrand factor A domain-containing protein 7
VFTANGTAGGYTVTASVSGVGTPASFSLTNTNISGGEPVINGTVADQGTSNGSFYIDLLVKNTGTGIGNNIQVANLAFQTLTGTGSVTYNSALSPQLPIHVGTLSAGSSTTVRLFLNVPSSVIRFSISETGTDVDGSGTSLNWSSGQMVFY